MDLESGVLVPLFHLVGIGTIDLVDIDESDSNHLGLGTNWYQQLPTKITFSIILVIDFGYGVLETFFKLLRKPKVNLVCLLIFKHELKLFARLHLCIFLFFFGNFLQFG